jgi:6-phosphofructokinase 1
MTVSKKKSKTKKSPAKKPSRKVDFKRVGILTGGGDCPGLNAVLRAVAKTAIINYGWEIIGINEGFEGLLTPGKTHKLELKDVRGLLPRGGTILGSTNRGNPFEHKVDKDGKKVVVDISTVAMDTYEKLELDALIVIGGDGSLKIAQRFFDMGMNVIGVPKTIDNDLMATDSTFGFRTAVQTATEAIDKLHTTGESHNRAMILEVMGRYVGWIALESGLAGGADIILIPEIPYDIDEVCGKIYRRNKAGSKFSIIVVAEGAKPKGGDVTIKNKAKDTDSLERLGGVGMVIGAQITEKTGVETRVTVLGHLQRGGTPSPFDRILSTRFGVKAVELAVDPDGQLVRTAEAIGIEFGR